MSKKVERVYNKNTELIGFKFPGIDLHIHRIIHDPDNWYLTCKTLDIHGELLCKKTVAEEALPSLCFKAVEKHRNEYTKVLKKISQFT